MKKTPINPRIAIAEVKEYLQHLQNRICAEIEHEDSHAKFKEDRWEKPKGGLGCTRVLSDGAIFERAGITFSHIYGTELPPAATAKRPDLVGRRFQAEGLSLVFHPRNPYAPTVHANLRLFIAESDNEDPIWWFGGGYDLTPYYGFEEDCHHWHKSAKAACDPFGKTVYANYKKACDQYFYLPHREEPRGIGGLFFDDLNEWGYDRCFEFIKSVAKFSTAS